LVQAPNKHKTSVIYGQIKKLIRTNTKELENYAGDSVLGSEEKLKKGERLIFTMIKMCTRLTARHDLANEKSKKSAIMLQYYQFESVKISQNIPKNKT
jgi:hypothetical protein